MLANAEIRPHSKNQLTAVVPIGNLAFDLDRFKTWVCEAISLGIRVILVLNLVNSKESKVLLEKFDPGLSNLEIVTCERRSPGFARNIGLELTDSEWIAFWDADDLPDPDRTIAAIQACREDSQIIVCEYERIDFKTLQPTYESHHTTASRLHWKDLGIWRMLFRRSLINETQFMDFQMGEDQFFFAAIMEKQPNLYISGIQNYKYFVNNDDQLTNSRRAINEIIHTQEATARYLRNNILESSYMLAFLVRQTYTCVKRCTYPNKAQAIGNLVRAIPYIASNLLIRIKRNLFKNAK